MLSAYTLQVANAIKVSWPCANDKSAYPDGGARIGYTMADHTLITSFIVAGFRVGDENCALMAAEISDQIDQMKLNRFAMPHGAPVMPGGEIHTVLVESPTGVIVRGIMSPDVLGVHVYRFDVLGGRCEPLEKARLIPWKVG